MDARSPRNTLLAAGVAFGAMAAVLVVVASSLSFSAIPSPGAIWSPRSVRWLPPSRSSSWTTARSTVSSGEHEGSLGSAAIVFAVGFGVATVGLILIARHAGFSARYEAEQGLQVVAELLLALAAVCGAIGFFASRREILRAAPQS